MSIFSLVGDLFGKKEKGGDMVNTTPTWLQALGKTLGTQLNTGISNYTPGAAYGGDLNVAGSPTGQEQSGLDILTKLLGGGGFSGGTGSLFSQASGQISDTLSGKYADPNQSPYIKAMTQIAKNNLSDQITQERGMRGARGTYFTDAGVQAEGKLRGRTMDNLNSVIGQFIQNERQNQLGAVGTAANLDKYQNLDLPTSLIGSSSQYGGLQRLIQKANLESQYQAYLNQRKEQSGALDTAAGLQNVTDIGQVRTPKYTTNNDLGNITGILDKIGSGAYSGFDGGDSGSGGIMQMLPQLLAMFA